MESSGVGWQQGCDQQIDRLSDRTIGNRTVAQSMSWEDPMGLVVQVARWTWRNRSSRHDVVWLVVGNAVAGTSEH